MTPATEYSMLHLVTALVVFVALLLLWVAAEERRAERGRETEHDPTG